MGEDSENGRTKALNIRLASVGFARWGQPDRTLTQNPPAPSAAEGRDDPSRLQPLHRLALAGRHPITTASPSPFASSEPARD